MVLHFDNCSSSVLLLFAEYFLVLIFTILALVCLKLFLHIHLLHWMIRAIVVCIRSGTCKLWSVPDCQEVATLRGKLFIAHKLC